MASLRTDVELMERARASDVEAFAEVYDRHAPAVLALLRRVLGDKVDAQDILHEATVAQRARAGVRYFISDEVSLDLALTGGFETGGGTREARSLTGTNITTEADFDQSLGFVGLYIGVSAWPDVS